jgi:orotidine-5'-phosphate decarboxylase
MFKIGSRLFGAEGPEAVRSLAGLGSGIFLDLKFHDIPSTVGGTVSATARLPKVRMLTLHALGGSEMLQAAVAAVGAGSSRRYPVRLLGVTILTSLDAADLRQVGIIGPLARRARDLAQLAQNAGLDGVVASAEEAAAIRRACGSRFLIVVPGVRPGRAGAKDDQIRVATPAGAIRAGADYVVVGRPITGARDPVGAARAILEEIAAARRRRV